jgi:hypothetical protein
MNDLAGKAAIREASSGGGGSARDCTSLDEGWEFRCLMSQGAATVGSGRLAVGNALGRRARLRAVGKAWQDGSLRNAR